MQKGIFCFIVFIWFASSCIKKSTLPTTPQISFNKIINDTIFYSIDSNTEKLCVLEFNYAVKDGNFFGNDSIANFYLRDLRNGANNFSFILPKFSNPLQKFDAEIGVMQFQIDASTFQIDLGKNIDSIKWEAVLITNKTDTSNFEITKSLTLIKI